MMFVFDITNPLTLLLITLATGLLIFLSQEIKKSLISAGVLFVFLAILIFHVVQILTISPELRVTTAPILYRCLIVDFLFVLVTFFAYLWVDDMEAKKFGKRNYDTSLDWFWKKV